MANSTTLIVNLRQRACSLLGISTLALALALLLAFALSAPAVRVAGSPLGSPEAASPSPVGSERSDGLSAKRPQGEGPKETGCRKPQPSCRPHTG